MSPNFMVVSSPRPGGRQREVVSFSAVRPWDLRPGVPGSFGGTAASGRRWAVPPDDSSRETPCLPEVPMDEHGHLLERLPGDWRGGIAQQPFTLALEDR